MEGCLQKAVGTPNKNSNLDHCVVFFSGRREVGPKRNETDIHLSVSSKKILATQQLSTVLFQNYFTLTPPNLHGKRFCPRKGIQKKSLVCRGSSRIWVVVSNICYFHPILGEMNSIWRSHMFQMGGEKPPPWSEVKCAKCGAEGVKDGARFKKMPAKFTEINSPKGCLKCPKN